MPLNSNRRHEIVELIPEGSVSTRAWLLHQGMTRHALDNLVKSKQLESLASGVYTRNGTKYNWQGVVYYLQEIAKTGLIVGGLTALELQGFAHYLSLGEKKTIHLYGTHKLPFWLNQLQPNINYVYHNVQELWAIKTTADGGKSMPADFTTTISWKEHEKALRISSPEMAYLEVLMDVPDQVSFEHADQLMQGLTTLSPRKLQKLLVQCNNIKVKRLFLWMADRYNYPWREKLNMTDIDLGKGKRALTTGGKLDKKYQITVPEIYA
jgi:hypothetical protein